MPTLKYWGKNLVLNNKLEHTVNSKNEVSENRRRRTFDKRQQNNNGMKKTNKNIPHNSGCTTEKEEPNNLKSINLHLRLQVRKRRHLKHLQCPPCEVV